jgi:hypothetical protein
VALSCNEEAQRRLAELDATLTREKLQGEMRDWKTDQYQQKIKRLETIIAALVSHLRLYQTVLNFLLDMIDQDAPGLLQRNGWSNGMAARVSTAS